MKVGRGYKRNSARLDFLESEQKLKDKKGQNLLADLKLIHEKRSEEKSMPSRYAKSITTKHLKKGRSEGSSQ